MQDSITQDNTSNNKRIAKNTLLLYLRMMFIMTVQLYTSRVVLNSLGIVDYGIYNVVGGIVAMFAFLNGAMVTSTQRYITFELGKGNLQRLKEVFATSIQIHLLISLIIILLGETVGLWFLYEKMVIPEERFTAAMWVYQLSILTMCIQVMSVPYNSDIVAHERMGAFAAISVIEVLLKLAVVYVLLIGNFDKLIFYAILIALLQLIIRFIYTLYCNKHFQESHIIKVFDKSLMKEMSKFMGWNIWGNLAATLFGTGLNLLLNMFFGPAVNAARAIAVQVETAIANFSTNFLMAVNPQITKLYAQNNLKEMHKLLFRASKFTFYLLLVLSLPVFFEADLILKVWLKIVPDYTVIFLRLLLCIIIVDSVARPLMTAAAATGDVKLYQSLLGGILLSIVPIAYVVLKLGGKPASVYVVHLVICVIAFLTRLWVIKPMIKLSIRQYFSSVILRCALVLTVSIPFCLLVKNLLPEGVLPTIIVCVVCVLVASVTSYTLGLDQGERHFVNTKGMELIHKFSRR
jgi:O-antigen/teichoic acid export membrane protein